MALESQPLVDSQPSLSSRMLLRKPLAVVLAEETESKLTRHLTLFDLLCIGIGGTVGSGVFVLCGHIANGCASTVRLLRCSGCKNRSPSSP